MLGNVFIFVSLLIILVAMFTTEKWKVWNLITKQIKNFSDWETQKPFYWEIAAFFIAPFFLSYGLTSKGANITNDGEGVLLNIVSIISGLLISGLIGINSFETKGNKNLIKLIEVASTYMMFSILLTTMILSTYLIKIFKLSSINTFIPAINGRQFYNCAILYLFILYIMNIFLILRKLLQILEEKKK